MKNLIDDLWSLLTLLLVFNGFSSIHPLVLLVLLYDFKIRMVLALMSLMFIDVEQQYPFYAVFDVFLNIEDL
jgi:hypothetical protein